MIFKRISLRNKTKYILLVIILLGLTSCSSVLEVYLDVNNKDAGEVKGDGQFVRDSIITIEAIPNVGYEFIGWEENGEVISNDERYLFKLDNRKSFTAVFHPREHLVNVSTEDYNKGNVTGGGTFVHGETITIRAIPNEGYMFVGWDNIDSYQATQEIVVNKSLRLAALFDEEVAMPIYNYSAEPELSPDGTYLAYMHDEVLVVHSLEENRAVVDIELRASASNFEQVSLRWLKDSTGLLVLDGENLFIYKFDGSSSQLTEGPIVKIEANNNYIYSIEGKQGVGEESTSNNETEGNIKNEYILKIFSLNGELLKEELLELEVSTDMQVKLLPEIDGERVAFSIGNEMYIYNGSEERFYNLSDEITGEVISWVLKDKVAFLDNETRSFQIYDLALDHRLMIFNMREVDLTHADNYFLGNNYLLVRGTKRDGSSESYYVYYDVLENIDELEFELDINTNTRVLTAAKSFEQIIEYEDYHILSADNKLVIFDEDFNPKLLYQSDTRVRMLGVLDSELVFLEFNRTNFYSLVKKVNIIN
jgi:hypothetical protein